MSKKFRDLVMVASTAVFSAARCRAIEGHGEDEDVADAVEYVLDQIRREYVRPRLKFFVDRNALIALSKIETGIMIDGQHWRVYR